jgi:tetratricopeptide (TPR) repeat protein
MFDRGTSSMQFASLSFANSYYNQSLVRQCLSKIQTLNQYEERISLLYIAFKELLKQGWWLENVDTSILEDWAAVSFALSEDLRWYGAHGHLKLGVIWHTLDYGSAIRTLQERGLDVTGKNRFSHFGALASEYYSLYKYIGKPNLQKSYQYISFGLDAGYGALDRHHLLSIRGACYLTDRKFRAAIDDFKEVIAFSERVNNANVNEVAHFHTKLGIAYFGSGRFAKGYSYAIESLKMFTADNADKVRSLRILNATL